MPAPDPCSVCDGVDEGNTCCPPPRDHDTHYTQLTTEVTMRLTTTTARIEMLVPDNMDPSDLLARMQALATEWAEEFDTTDDDDETPEVDSDHLENAVSVQVPYDPADDEQRAAELKRALLTGISLAERLTRNGNHVVLSAEGKAEHSDQIVRELKAVAEARP